MIEAILLQELIRRRKKAVIYLLKPGVIDGLRNKND